MIQAPKDPGKDLIPLKAMSLTTAADARMQLSREQGWATDHERPQHEADQHDHDMAMDVVLGAASTAPTLAAPILSRKNNRRRRINSSAPPPLASIDHEGDGTRPRRPVRTLKNGREDEEGEERASPSSTALLRRGLLSSSDDHSQTQKEGEGSICASRPLLLFIIVPVPLVAIALIIFGICHCCKKDDKKKTAKENESGGQKRKNATTSSIVPGGAAATTAVDFNLMRPLSMGGAGADKNYAGGFDGAPNGNGTHLHSSPEVAGAGAAPVDARDVVVIKSIGYPGSPSTSGLTSTAYREWQDTNKSGTDAFLSSIKGQDPPSVQFPSTSSTATAGDLEPEGTATSQILEASGGDVLPGAAAGGVKNVGLHNQEEDEARLGSTQPLSGDGLMSKANDSSYFGAEAINMSQKQDSVFAGTSSGTMMSKNDSLFAGRSELGSYFPAGQPESGTETPSSAAALGGRTRKKAKRVVMKRTKSGLKRPTSSKPPTSPLSGVVTPSSSGQSEDDEVVGTGSLTSAQEMSSFHNLSSAGGAGSGQSQPSKQPKEAAARLTKTPSQAPGATASDVPEKIFPSSTTLQIPPLLTTPDEGRAAEDDEDALRSYQSEMLLHSKNYNADGPSATLDSTNSLALDSYLSVPEHLQNEGGGLGKTESGMASFRMIIPQGLANTIKRAKRMRELGQQGKSGKDTPETLLLELERALIDGKALGKGENYKSGIQRSDDIGKSTSGAQHGANQMKGQQPAPAVKALSKRLAKVLKHAAAKNKAKNNNKASTRGGLEDKGKKSVESPQESPRTLLDEVATALEAEEDKNEKARVLTVTPQSVALSESDGSLFSDLLGYWGDVWHSYRQVLQQDDGAGARGGSCYCSPAVAPPEVPAAAASGERECDPYDAKVKVFGTFQFHSAQCAEMCRQNRLEASGNSRLFFSVVAVKKQDSTHQSITCHSFQWVQRTYWSRRGEEYEDAKDACIFYGRTTQQSQEAEKTTTKLPEAEDIYGVVDVTAESYAGPEFSNSPCYVVSERLGLTSMPTQHQEGQLAEEAATTGTTADGMENNDHGTPSPDTPVDGAGTGINVGMGGSTGTNAGGGGTETSVNGGGPETSGGAGDEAPEAGNDTDLAPGKGAPVAPGGSAARVGKEKGVKRGEATSFDSAAEASEAEGVRSAQQAATYEKVVNKSLLAVDDVTKRIKIVPVASAGGEAEAEAKERERKLLRLRQSPPFSREKVKKDREARGGPEGDKERKRL
eukprot:g8586.t1